MKLCNTSQNTTCNITEINREEHNKRKITRVGCKTMSFDIISLLSVIIHSIWPKRAFWGKESLSCSILRGSLLTVWFYLPIHHFVIKKKKSILLFPYLNYKFNKDLFEQDKTPNLYTQQNTWIQKSTIKVFISNKICVVIIYIRLAMTVIIYLHQVIFPY